MATYVSDGLTLHYDVIGNGEPILCVHGATGAGTHEWSKLAARLADTFQLVMPDVRSHRLSEHRPGAVGIEHVVGDLLALVRELDLGRPHVMGFSFGAEVALDLELTHPGTCRSLVLLSPGLGDPKSSVPTPERLVATWPDSLRRLHTDTHGEDHWLEVMLELCQRAAERPKMDLARVAAMRCPVLLVAGSQDDPRRIRQAQVMEEHHHGSRLVVVDGAAHAVHKSHAEDVARIIRGFLGQGANGVPGGST